MERDSSGATIRMTKLLVGAALANLFEPEGAENRHDLAGLQDRRARHG